MSKHCTYLVQSSKEEDEREDDKMGGECCSWGCFQVIREENSITWGEVGAQCLEVSEWVGG